FFFQAEDGIRDYKVTGVQTCALPISARAGQQLTLVVEAQRPHEAAHTVEPRNDLVLEVRLGLRERRHLAGEDEREAGAVRGVQRSEERRVGKELRFRWSQRLDNISRW